MNNEDIKVLEDTIDELKGNISITNTNDRKIQAIENLIKEYKELEATLKQTQDSWYEDTKKIELNNECEIALNNRIMDLENELNKEKEKNKKVKKFCKEKSTFQTFGDEDMQYVLETYINRLKHRILDLLED